MIASLRLAPLALALAVPATAQRYLVAEPFPPAVHLLDVQAGGVFQYDLFRPDNLPPVTALREAARVGHELWLATTRGIGRYDATTFDRVGWISGADFNGLQPVSDGAWASTSGAALVKFDFAGNVVFTAPGAQAMDVFSHGGELLVATLDGDRVARYDLGGQFLGYLTPPGLGQSASLDHANLAELSSRGTLLLAALTEAWEIDPVTGLVLAEYDCGVYEQSVLELSDGRLLSVNAAYATLYDPEAPIDQGQEIPQTLGHKFGSIALYDAGDPGIQRFCTAGPNSVGPGASISVFGTTDLADGALWLDAVDGPPQGVGLFVYGRPGSGLPFGGGELCIDPFSPGVVRAPAPLGTFDATGSRLFVELAYRDFPAAAPITPGSTWAFQYLYRDPAGVPSATNATDAIALTFD